MKCDHFNFFMLPPAEGSKRPAMPVCTTCIQPIDSPAWLAAHTCTSCSRLIPPVETNQTCPERKRSKDAPYPPHTFAKRKLRRQTSQTFLGNGLQMNITMTECGESWTVWQLWPPDFTDQMIRNMLDAAGLNIDGYRSRVEGRPFADRVSIRRTATRVLVTQRCGLDV